MNLKSFKLKNTVNKDNAFPESSLNIKYCIEDSETKNFLKEIKSDCSNDCFKENIKIDIENKICIDSCLKNGYKYEYNNICFNECPKDTFYKFSDGNNSEEKTIECFDKTPQGYYLDINAQIYKKYISCPNGTYYNFSNNKCQKEKTDETKISSVVNPLFSENNKITDNITKDERDEDIQNFRNNVNDYNISESKEDKVEI